MEKISATFKVNTHMFIGGPKSTNEEMGKKEIPEIRPPSIKGALRFWWRAIVYAEIVSKMGEKSALAELHKRESHLFGGVSEGNDGALASKILIKVRNVHIRRRDSRQNVIMDYKVDDEQLAVNNGLKYLLGQGLYSVKTSSITRRFVIPETHFDLDLGIKRNVSEADKLSVLKALECFGLLGALGSRARKGLGSVQLVKCDHESINVTQTKNDYLQKVVALFSNSAVCKSKPLFSAFTAHTAAYYLSARSANAILEQAGKKMFAYRSNGYKSKDGKHTIDGSLLANSPFKHDHVDLADTIQHHGSKIEQYRKAVFGLPINLPKNNNSYKNDMTVEPVNKRGESTDSRRASPLLLHVHHVGGEYIGIYTLFGGHFLPDYFDVQVTSKKQQTISIEKAPDFKEILDFLSITFHLEHKNGSSQRYDAFEPLFIGDGFKEVNV